MGNQEPPACIQNAMMTKDKKPFTYTPGGLDLSQIKTPSMARRLARQRSQEEHEQAYAQQQANGGYHPQGGGAYHQQGAIPPPPPPPQNVPAPPPPPPLIIENQKAKSPKPIVPGERPEIVIPENPIGMLRKTNSPYHWEAEKADLQRIGPVPKFMEKAPSPLSVQMGPSTFSQQPPQSYVPQNQNVQRQNYPCSNQNPGSPLHKPEAQYATSPPIREALQRQDSQFNKSPLPFAGQSPVSNGSPFSPSPNSSWRQPEKRDSPASASPQANQFNRSQFSPNNQQYSPNQNQQQNTQQFSPNQNQQYSPNQNQQQYSPNQNQQPQYSPNQNKQFNSSPNSGQGFHTIPRAGSRPQENLTSNNNTQQRSQSPSTAPWRSNVQNRPKEAENPQSIYHNSQPINQQPTYTPPWKQQEVNNNQTEQNSSPPWKQEIRNARNQPSNQNQYNPPWVSQETNNNNNVQENYIPPWRQTQNNKPQEPQPEPPRYPSQVETKPQSQEQPRYQSTMSIPVKPRNPKPEPEYQQTPPQREVVYVNQEPVYYCPESPNAVPPFVKAQKEKTKTPPPIWCQRPLDGRKSLPRELCTPPREVPREEPEWVKKSNEMQRNVREVVSPPKYQQPQPTWSTRPSENRKSIPNDDPPNAQSNSGRVIPIQMDLPGDHGQQGGNQPQLRITIGLQPSPSPNHQPQSSPAGPYSQPTQRIMRVLSPQLVRMDDGPFQHELPTLNRNLNNLEGPKTRIIPIQIEGGGGDGANKR